MFLGVTHCGSRVFFALPTFQPAIVEPPPSRSSRYERMWLAMQSACLWKPRHVSLHEPLSGQPQPNAKSSAFLEALVLPISDCSICSRVRMTSGLMRYDSEATRIARAADIPPLV
jgi:hypothetical protein